MFDASPETATYRSDPRIARVQADLDRVDQVRASFPALADRRPSAYGIDRTNIGKRPCNFH